MNPATLRTAVESLLAHHDALRVRFQHHAANWTQFFAPSESADRVYRHYEWSHLADEKQRSQLQVEGEQWQATLNLEVGPVIRVSSIDLGPERGTLIAMVVHHLAIDAVSWRFVVEDLERAYDQAARGEQVELGAKSTSYLTWARALHEHARGTKTQGELDYWLNAAGPVSNIPGESRAPAGEYQSIDDALTESETQGLLQDVAGVYRTEINETLLSALAVGWGRWKGEWDLTVDMEGHGREDVVEGLDVGRTAGWFTTMYPVRLRVSDGLTEEILSTLKQQVRAIPRRGIGYGLLRYLADAEPSVLELRDRRSADVAFNYLGQLDSTVQTGGRFRLPGVSPGPNYSGRATRSHRLLVSGKVLGGRLWLSCTFHPNDYSGEDIKALIRHILDWLREAIDSSQSQRKRSIDPSEYEAFGWNADDLFKIASAVSSD
jgi:non-ribosomal peptide synthase protein (TIGR01720 family)